jgi:hypothetical protein
MARLSRRIRFAGVALVMLVALGLALGYGVAQSTVVTQAEWAVYVAQGLGLDWNLPENPKSNHYLARLNWTKSVEFRASSMLDGSTAQPSADGSIRTASMGPSEALYEVSMLRAGDYGFRVELAGGGATLKVADQTFDVYQPSPEPRWVDLDRIPVGPGSHKMSLLLTNGTSARSLGVTPPCMLPVEPIGGWTPLEPLRFDQMAVTLAKALDLEQDLPEIGDATTIRGESFIKTLVYPFEEQEEQGEDDPFWLSSGDSIVTAVARFDVTEPGVYSVEARYISSRPVRWNMDSCLRVVTCPVTPNQIGRRRSLALTLEPGTHEIEVTLAPGAKLDRIDVQRRDGSVGAYLDVVADQGFRLGNANENVTRRQAISAAKRLRDRFMKLATARCDDTLVAMEAMAIANRMQTSSTPQAEPFQNGNAPGASSGTSQVSFADPVFPPVDANDPRVATPVQPGQ